jgi:hypothetical protein
VQRVQGGQTLRAEDESQKSKVKSQKYGSLNFSSLLTLNF